MGYYFLQLTPYFGGVIKIEALYKDADFELGILDFVSGIQNFGQTENSSHLCTNLINELHELFIKNGDRADYREKFKSDPVQWYMATAELSLLDWTELNKIRFCHLGMAHIYVHRSTRNEIELISPIHNVKSELQAGTIEASCLAPFSSRSNREIAQQLMDEPKFIKRLENLSQDQFYEAIGHVRTRNIGYVQNPATTERGVYRPEPPLAEFWESLVEHNDAIAIYLPNTVELINYDEKTILEKTTKILSHNFVPIRHKAILNGGQLVLVTRDDKTISATTST